jgi:hypothetical protein
MILFCCSLVYKMNSTILLFKDLSTQLQVELQFQGPMLDEID